MVMKIRKYLYLVLFLCSACTDWLDITPKNTVVEEDLFDSYMGYRNALNGVYEYVSGASLYGQEMSWGYLDVLGQCYLSGTRTIGRYHPYYKVMSFSYTDTDVKGYAENIWSNTYKGIANCNNIIGQIGKEDATIFPEGESERELILGEAMALRAFLHFDMLRLFAPAPVADDNRTYIPWFDKFPSYGESNRSVSEILEKVVADLQTARQLVAQFDTLDKAHLNRLGHATRFAILSNGTAPDDVFYAYRGYRMNYPAITALLARVYNYAGNHELAKKCAEEVIPMLDEWGGRLFYFTTLAEAKGANKKMSCDLIFALSSPKLYERYLPYTNSSGGTGDACLVLKDVASMFDDLADYRGTYLLTPINSYKASFRNIRATTDATGRMIEDMLPVIRLSELHYILAEYHAAREEWGLAAEALDVVREGRNCTKGALAEKIKDKKSFQTELLKEVRREFVTEGQVFFYYKKLNEKLTAMMDPEAFVLPLPDSESIN